MARWGLVLATASPHHGLMTDVTTVQTGYGPTRTIHHNQEA